MAINLPHTPLDKCLSTPPTESNVWFREINYGFRIFVGFERECFTSGQILCRFFCSSKPSKIPNVRGREDDNKYLGMGFFLGSAGRNTLYASRTAITTLMMIIFGFCSPFGGAFTASTVSRHFSRSSLVSSLSHSAHFSESDLTVRLCSGSPLDIFSFTVRVVTYLFFYRVRSPDTYRPFRTSASRERPYVGF